MKLGKLIVIEGATDGIGKSTQIEKLKTHLEADGKKVATHHFPTYYSYQGQGVEKYLQGEYGTPDQLSPYFINSLYAYDRAITWRIKLKNLYNKGRVILLDRYTTSSLIYQPALIKNQQEKRDFLDYVIDFEYNKLGIQQPDHVFFLHMPFDMATKMRQGRLENEGIANDLHERNLEFLQTVYDNSMYIAKYLGWTMIDCTTADGKAIRTPDDIHAEIYQHLQSTRAKTL